MNQERQIDKLICCGGAILMAMIAVFGYWCGNHDIALFGATGFTAFSGPLFRVMNREIGSANGNGKSSGSSDPTKG